LYELCIYYFTYFHGCYVMIKISFQWTYQCLPLNAFPVYSQSPTLVMKSISLSVIFPYWPSRMYFAGCYTFFHLFPTFECVFFFRYYFNNTNFKSWPFRDRLFLRLSLIYGFLTLVRASVIYNCYLSTLKSTTQMFFIFRCETSYYCFLYLIDFVPRCLNQVHAYSATIYFLVYTFSLIPLHTSFILCVYTLELNLQRMFLISSIKENNNSFIYFLGVTGISVYLELLYPTKVW